MEKSCCHGSTDFERSNLLRTGRGGTLSEEYLDVLDSVGRPTGRTKLRREVHRDGDWHRAVHIWIINHRREVLLQKRAADKDSWPNRWDISCGGHLVAGEDSLTGALCELKEELGLCVSKDDLYYLTTTQSSTRVAKDFINNSFYDLFWLQTNCESSDFRLQTSELSEVKFVSAVELQAMLNERPSPLVPHTEAYQIVLKLLAEL